MSTVILIKIHGVQFINKTNSLYVLVWKPVQLHEVKNVSVLNSVLVIVCNKIKEYKYVFLELTHIN